MAIKRLFKPPRCTWSENPPAVATSRLIGAVMETASLPRPAFIDAEDMNSQRSGCFGEQANPLHQARSASAERVTAAARQEEELGNGGSRRSRGQAPASFGTVGSIKSKARGQEPLASKQRLAGAVENKSQCASSTASSRLSQSQRALPNPSIKPSPNSKPPGQRYSAGLLLLQRWPGVSPLVPAYVER